MLNASEVKQFIANFLERHGDIKTVKDGNGYREERKTQNILFVQYNNRL